MTYQALQVVSGPQDSLTSNLEAYVPKDDFSEWLQHNKLAGTIGLGEEIHGETDPDGDDAFSELRGI